MGPQVPLLHPRHDAAAGGGRILEEPHLLNRAANLHAAPARRQHAGRAAGEPDLDGARRPQSCGLPGVLRGPHHCHTLPGPGHDGAGAAGRQRHRAGQVQRHQEPAGVPELPAPGAASALGPQQ